MTSVAKPAVLQAPNVEIRWQKGGLLGTSATELSLSTNAKGVTWALANENNTGLKGLSLGRFGMVGKEVLAVDQAKEAAATLYKSLGDLSADTYRPSFSEPKLSNSEFAVGVAKTKDDPFKWYTFYGKDLPVTGNKPAVDALAAAKEFAKVVYDKGNI